MRQIDRLATFAKNLVGIFFLYSIFTFLYFYCLYSVCLFVYLLFSSCPKGWTGTRCEISFTPTPQLCTLKCLNGGICVIEEGKPKCKYVVCFLNIFISISLSREKTLSLTCCSTDTYIGALVLRYFCLLHYSQELFSASLYVL